MRNSGYPCEERESEINTRISKAICLLRDGAKECGESARQIECGCVCDGEKDTIDGICLEERGLAELEAALEAIDKCAVDWEEIEKGLREIHKGIKDEKEGLCDVLNFRICEGVNDIRRGEEEVEEGIEHVLRGLKCRKRNECEYELEKGVRELREGIRLTCEGIEDEERCRLREAEEDFERALRELECALEDLEEAAEDCDFDCRCGEEFEGALRIMREGNRLIRHALRDLCRGAVCESLVKAREGLELEENALHKILRLR